MMNLPCVSTHKVDFIRSQDGTHVNFTRVWVVFDDGDCYSLNDFDNRGIVPGDVVPVNFRVKKDGSVSFSLA